MAAELLSGPPGSGKKEYIRNKIAEYLLSGGDPSKILLITNSRSSSEYFREFILSFSSSSKGIFTESITTLSKRLLREYYYLTDLRPGFRVISDFEKRLIVKNVLNKKRNLRYFSRLRPGEGLVREVSNFLDRAARSPGWKKRALISGSAKFKDLLLIYEAYENILKELNLADFSSLTECMLKLLRNNSSLGASELLLVYQSEDMDRIAGDIILLLTARAYSSVVSLDISSGIYSFRGAEPWNLRRKILALEGIKEVRLKPSEKHPKSFRIPALSPESEMRLISSHIASLLKSGIRPAEIGVIARSVGEETSVLAEAFSSYGINSVISGGIGFFREKEVTQIISFLEALLERDSAEESHIYRALQLSGIIEEEELDSCRRSSLIKSRPLLDTLSEDKRKEYLKFLESFKVDQMKGVPELIYSVMSRLGFLKEAAMDRRSSMIYGYLLKSVTDYSDLTRRMTGSKPLFRYFMENIFELLSGFGKDMDIPVSEEEEAVRIMTVQQAKGERFRVVYLMDMVEGIFPREFMENPLLSTREQRALGIKPPEDRKRQLINEHKLFKAAESSADETLIYAYYTADNASSPVEVSEFISLETSSDISLDINNNVNVEREFLLKSASDLSDSEREELASLIDKDLGDSLIRINRLGAFQRDSVHDMVTEGIPDTFSSSSLSCYADCPALFFINNILRLSSPDTIHLLFGTAVHRMLQLYHSDSMEKDTDKIAARSWLETGIPQGFEGRNYFFLAKKMLLEYILSAREENFTVEKTEESFRFSHRGSFFAGRFDRIDRVDGALRVADYKTGSGIKGEKGLINALKRGENYQIPVYAKASGADLFTVYRLRFDAPRMRVTLELNTEDISEALREGWKSIDTLTDSIREGLFRPSPGNACRNCYFSRCCNEA